MFDKNVWQIDWNDCIVIKSNGKVKSKTLFFKGKTHGLRISRPVALIFTLSLRLHGKKKEIKFDESRNLPRFSLWLRTDF
jgi:hypothetical protein